MFDVFFVRTLFISSIRVQTRRWLHKILCLNSFSKKSNIFFAKRQKVMHQNAFRDIQPQSEYCSPRGFLFTKHAVTEYFIGWSISSFVIKSCTVKESFIPLCTQICLFEQCNLWLRNKETFLNRQVGLRVNNFTI